ncbi:MAG: hypothetical protein IKE56_06645 [Lachnospiraceae bacterium]|nr:hypothetical protein [Lachnospiraceae bacterium]
MTKNPGTAICPRYVPSVRCAVIQRLPPGSPSGYTREGCTACIQITSTVSKKL